MIAGLTSVRLEQRNNSISRQCSPCILWRCSIDRDSAVEDVVLQEMSSESWVMTPSALEDLML